MSRIKKNVISVYFMVAFCSLFFLSYSSNCLAATTSKTENPITLHIQDRNSFVNKKLKAKKRLIRKSPLHRVKNKTVEIAKNQKTTLSNIASATFNSQNLFQKRLKNLPTGRRGVLLNKPLVKEMVYEFKDSFVLIKSTRIIVQNPSKLSNKSPEFRRFLGKKKQGRVVLSKLNRESKRWLNNFIKMELPRLHKDHPLRKAAKGKKGDQQKIAILKAIGEGKGQFETLEEVVIPKKMPRMINGKFMVPRFRNGIFDYGQMRPTKFKIPKTVRLPRAIKETLSNRQATPNKSTRMVKVSQGRMRKRFKANFLTGETLGCNLEFNKKWKWTGGHFRLHMWAGYTVGLRIPIEAKGHMKPTWIHTTSQNKDTTTYWKTHINVKPIDGDVNDFSNAGWNKNNDIRSARGKEFALGYDFGYSYAVRMLGTNLLEDDYSNKKDWNRDFTPPYDKSSRIYVWIPPSWTNSDFSVGPIIAELKFGFSIKGKGKVSFLYDSFHARKHNRQNITFYNPETKIIQNAIAPMTLSARQTSKTEKYGFSLSNPKYEVKPILTPCASIDVGIDYLWDEWHLGPIAFSFGALKVTYPNYIPFGTHRDTEGTFVLDIGDKKFTKK